MLTGPKLSFASGDTTASWEFGSVIQLNGRLYRIVDVFVALSSLTFSLHLPVQ
jgi:hypothetical protein